MSAATQRLDVHLDDINAAAADAYAAYVRRNADPKPNADLSDGARDTWRRVAGAVLDHIERARKESRARCRPSIRRS